MVSPDPGGVVDEVSTMAKANFKSNEKKQAQEKQGAVQRDMAD
jgi:hypothetical protein